MAMEQAVLPYPPAGASVAVALGSGGARGLAHLWVLEALDELGIRPAAISGASIGAIYGAAYAGGLSARELRHVTAETLRRRGDVFARLLPTRTGRFVDLLGGGLVNPVLLDAEAVVEAFLKEIIPENFSDLAIPFHAVATDYYSKRECVLSAGPLRSAVAASIAIPGLLKPVVREGRVLIDGGAVNPLPFDVVAGRASIIVASDVTGGPSEGKKLVPPPGETMFAALQIMMTAIVDEKLKAARPDVLVRPNVSIFHVLDFLKATAILKVSEPVKDEVKRGIEHALETVATPIVSQRRSP